MVLWVVCGKTGQKHNYYLDIAENCFGTAGTCLRRKYGAIIVNNDEIISTGYRPARRAVEKKTVY